MKKQRRLTIMTWYGTGSEQQFKHK